MNATVSHRSHALAFWLLAAILGCLLASASAPSPLYPVYQSAFGFPASTLTAIYAVYALGAIAALLFGGRLSDYIGRRRVTALGLLVNLAAALVFLTAGGVGSLFVARLLQGIGTGIAAGSVNAWLIDLQPPHAPRFGSLVGGIALVAGLGSGALVTGLLVQFGPDPLHLVFLLLVALFVATLGVTAILPDLVVRRPGWVSSLRPVVAVPPAARPAFKIALPTLVAIWAVGGLYLSLGPSVAVPLFESATHLAGGIVIAALLGSAAIAQAFASGAAPRDALLGGSIVVVAGVLVTLLAVVGASFAGLILGSVLAGMGLGPALQGVLRTLTPVAPAAERGALLASIYLVVYVSFSIPAVAAGVAVGVIGLRSTTLLYGALAIALALATALLMRRRAAPAHVP